MSGEHAPGDTIADRYRIIGVLGRGGSAVTYEAEDGQGNRVAIKQLQLWQDKEWKDLELFQREARVLAALRHPNVPRYHEYLQLETSEGPAFYLVRELVEGRSLAELVATGWMANELEAKRITRQLLGVLGDLHVLAPPIVHRDIKPSNLLMRTDGTLSLVDFGAVRKPEQVPDGSTVVGTYGYMAPEQFRGSAQASSDLYGVGATVLFLLSRREPSSFPQDGLRVRFRDQVALSPSFADWLERLLEPDPKDRFATAQAALQALDQQLKPRAAKGSAAKSRVARTVAVALGIGLCVAAAAGAGVYYLGGLPRGDDVEVETRREPAPSPGRWIPPIHTLGGSWGMSQKVIFAAKGWQVVVANREEAVQRWDVGTGKVSHTYSGGGGKTSSLALSKDERVLSSGIGRNIVLWDYQSGEVLQTLEGHRKGVLDIAMTPDGKRIVSGDSAGLVCVWDVEAGALMHQMKHEGGRVLAVAISADGRTALSGGDTGVIRVWEVESGKRRRSMEGHQRAVNQLVISPDGQTLASACDDRTARLWLLNSGRHVRTLGGHGNEVWVAAFSKDGKTLLTGTRSDVIRHWDVLSGREQKRQPAKLGAVMGLAFTSRGHRFAASGANGKIRIWPAPDAVWIPPLPPRDYQPPPPARKVAKSREEGLCNEADALIDARDAQAGNLQKARTLVEEAIALNPSYATAHALRARVEYAQGFLRSNEYRPGSLTRALAHVDRALELDPKLAIAYVRKAYIYSFQDNRGEAQRMAEEAQKLAPDAIEVAVLRATLAIDKKRYEEALGILRKAYEGSKDPSDLSTLFSKLGKLYGRMGHHEARGDMYVAQIRVDPGSAWVRGNYAHFLIWRGEHKRAIEMAKSALERMDYPAGRKTLSDAYAGHAIYLAGRSKFDEAEKTLELASQSWRLNAETEFAWSVYYRVKAYAEVDPPLLDKSKSHLDRALQIDPKHAKAKAWLDRHEWVVDELAKKK